MTPESLIKQLESLGSIDSAILSKLRRRIENPERSASVNQILSYLVKQQFISKAEAIQLKKAGTAKPTSDSGQRRETDELLEGVMDPEDAKAPAIDDEFGFAEDQADDIDDRMDELEIFSESDGTQLPDDDIEADVADAVAELVEDEFDDEPVKQRVAGYRDFEAYSDPMAATLGELSSMPHPTERHRSAVGFAGKIDSRDQWATKWVYIGFGSLGLLLVVGTLLVFFLSLITAEDRFSAANQSFQDGTYGDAIRKYEEFLERHPSHKNAPMAKVKRVQSLLLDTYKQKNYNETVVRAGRELPKLIEDDSIDLEPIRQDLAVILPTSALEIARRATKQDSKSALVEQLAKAKNAKLLVDNPVYIPNSKRKQATIARILDNVEEEISKGEGLIRKQDDFDGALAKISALREQGESEQAFATYNALIRSYGDLQANETLQTEMRQVSELESRLVKPIEPGINTFSSFRPSPIQSSIILASTTGSTIESLTGKIVPILADGSVYGIDIGNGLVKWRTFVGYQTVVQPQMPDGETVLIADQQNHDLLMLRAADGTLVWRSEIGESFLEPQIDESTIFLTTENGKLIRLDLASGAAQAAVKIPQTANVPLTWSSRTGLVIQPGFYSNLYLLSAADLTCKDVFYLGHYRGSISAPPVVWNNMILVAINQSGVCDLNVLKPSEDGINLELVQRVRRVTRGIVTNPLIRFGRFMLITSESGDLKILELNTADETSPIRVLAEEKFENREAARIHVATAGSQLWIGFKGIMRYKVSRALGTFDRQLIANPDDFFTGPVHKFGDAVIHVRKRSGSAMTSVSAVDADSLDQIWRTDLGGPVAGSPRIINNNLAAISSQGDLFTAPLESTTNQVAIDETRSSTIIENLLFDQVIELSPETSVCLGPQGRADMLYVDFGKKTSKLMRLPAPADKAASRPIEIDGDLIIPTTQGQVVRVDPQNSHIVGTPFLPPVSPGAVVAWKQPGRLENDQFVIGAGQNLYLIDASDNKLLRKAAESSVEGTLKSGITTIGDLAFAVLDGNPSDKLISLRVDSGGLQPVGSMELGGLAIDGPWSVGNSILVRLDHDQLVCVDQNLAQKWSTTPGPGTLATPPVWESDSIQLYFSDGRLMTLAAETGEVQATLELGQPIAHRPVISNGQGIFAGLDGTIHIVNLSTAQ